MKKYEYKRILFEAAETKEFENDDGECVEQDLVYDKYSKEMMNKLGEAGWEFVQTYEDIVGNAIYAIFKREKPFDPYPPKREDEKVSGQSF